MSQASLARFRGPVVQGNLTTSSSTSPANKIVYVTAISNLLDISQAGASDALMIYQTQPLDLHDSIVPTKIRAPVPEITVTSLDIFTAPANADISIKANAKPTKSDSGPTRGSSVLTPIPSPSTLSPAAITGIILSTVALAIALTALAIFLYLRRKSKKTEADMEAPKPEETLAEKVARGREYQRKRWSARETAMNQERFNRLKAKLAARENVVAEVDETFVIGDGEEDRDAVKKEAPIVARPGAARRPSGLAMHPPIPSDAVNMEDSDPKVGRAI
ncbi:hypothetical protein ST47_g6122 [Ascochyta rabiei]|uniref:Uncharacterized protein n=2 Tax=Didymella rabiei TaxID=5454 RepID=A0A163CUR7_DIDRA|nr:hypothetical protein ST47_g6122 [Ascochyta rabiei]